MPFFDLLPALGFFLLNVFVPGPNVLNTIATSTGSGYRAGLACALACGLGILLWASAALFGAAAFFETYPLANQSLIILGGSLLIYFAVRYLRKAFNPQSQLESIQDQSFSLAFWQAFVVMMTNPKVLTTWLAVISLFPIITLGLQNILGFILLSAAASFSGHAIFATFFSSKTAAAMYLLLYRPLNGLVGIGFFFYGIKLLSGAFV
ncbi:MAG: LysE family transporter [Paracoccaceae bacterium]|nr:LysE family transporter [Paracoccaceae bacterium]|tara:strand:+ start:347 stop:967 length:621 start_codon:yes stop_codon:yes gene_type:complete